MSKIIRNKSVQSERSDDQIKQFCTQKNSPISGKKHFKFDEINEVRKYSEDTKDKN